MLSYSTLHLKRLLLRTTLLTLEATYDEEKQRKYTSKKTLRANMSSENRIIHEIVEALDQLLVVCHDLDTRAKPRLYPVNDNNHQPGCHVDCDLNVTQPPPPPPSLPQLPLSPSLTPPTPPPRTHSIQVTSQLFGTSNLSLNKSKCERSSPGVPALCNEVTSESAITHRFHEQQPPQEQMKLQESQETEEKQVRDENGQEKVKQSEQKHVHDAHKQLISASGSFSSNVSTESSSSNCSAGSSCSSQFVRKTDMMVTSQKTGVVSLTASNAFNNETCTSGYFIVDKLNTFNRTNENFSCQDTLESNNNNQPLALPPCVCKLCTCKQSDDTFAVDLIEAPMNNPKSIIIKSSYSSLPAEVDDVTRSTSSSSSSLPVLTTSVIAPQIIVKVTTIVDYVPISCNNQVDYFVGKIFLTWKENEIQDKLPLQSQSNSRDCLTPSSSTYKRKQYLMSLNSCNGNNISHSTGEFTCCCPDVKSALSSKSTPTLDRRYIMNHTETCKHTSSRLSVSSPSLLLKKPRVTATTFKRQQFGQQVEALELYLLEQQLSETLSEIENLLENTLQYKQFDCRSYNKTYDPRHISDTQCSSGDLLTMPVYHKIQLYTKTYIPSDHTTDSVTHLVVREMDALLSSSTRATIDR